MGASSRYRLLQYVPLLETAGHEVQVDALLPDEYLEALYATSKRHFLSVLVAYTRRFARLRKSRDYDVVIWEQELLPFVPAFVDLMGKGQRLVIDFDDAPHVKYRGIPGLRNKIPDLIQHASAIVAGNRNLVEYASAYNQNVHLIPTVVDTAEYASLGTRSGEAKITVVWVGTPITARAFLVPLLPQLEALQRRLPQIEFCFIGSGHQPEFAGLRLRVEPWSEQTEKSLISACDIGIMPLNDDEFSRYKCGLKLIQYMAAGLPVVASAVGANCDIVIEGQTGFLARQPSDWVAILERMAKDFDLRARLGAAGQTQAKQQFSLNSGFPRWMTVLDSLPV